jgi:hypothetical protein
MMLAEMLTCRSRFVSKMSDRTLIRHMNALFELGVVAGLTDGQLLEQFTAREGAGAEAAFAALVGGGASSWLCHGNPQESARSGTGTAAI